MAAMNISDFQSSVYTAAAKSNRSMPWRDDTRAYYVHVSEMMLQQTQVDRVIPKFNAFIEAFPNYEVLAATDLQSVLQLWSGLGYNRRAKFLYMAARTVVNEHEGRLPNDEAALVALPGIGKNTAAAIRAYAFNEPVVYIETNIRTVFIHHFFEDRVDVSDGELLSLIESAVDIEHSREWYWAIMDYGSMLKKSIGNVSRASAHYKKQSAFAGSKRQVRGRIIKYLARDTAELLSLSKHIDDERFEEILQDLVKEKLVAVKGSRISISPVV